MNNFMHSYDVDSDDLLIRLEGKKSSGAIESGDFIYDFDEDGCFVGMQILNASEILPKLLHKAFSLANILNVEFKVTNFRNNSAIEIIVELDSGKQRATFLIPKIKKGSPVLNY